MRVLGCISALNIITLNRLDTLRCTVEVLYFNCKINSVNEYKNLKIPYFLFIIQDLKGLSHILTNILSYDHLRIIEEYISQLHSKMEGIGGPVGLDQYNLDGIDPALEDCCRREVCS